MAAKPGDTVRYLNAKGGGVVTRVEGKVAYVEEDGFETPVLINEIVVVLPAGHEKKAGGPNLMFDQAAFDAGKSNSRVSMKTETSKTDASKTEALKTIATTLPVVETKHGDRLNIALAFEPTAIRTLDKSDFNAVLVNDSNYFIQFTFMRRSDDERGWHTVYAGDVAPNELIDLAVIKRDELNDYERISLQMIAYKKDKEFEMKPPMGISRKLDLTKFFKLHCFRPGLYFENPVIEIMLVKDDVAEKPIDVRQVHILDERGMGKEEWGKKDERGKGKDERPGKGKRERMNTELNPHKLLPLIEVDLHINELTETTAGMENKDMLQMQLDEVRKTMKANAKRMGQKIVFIHGKGDGVLRKAVRDLLKREYPKADIQDASFQEYGFGATLVTVK